MSMAKRTMTVLMMLALSAGAALANERALEFTTQSEEAKKLVDKITEAIENFQPPPVLQQLSQQISEADPDFAFGVMISSLFQPNPQALETLNKAQEMAAKASEGERLYIQGMVHSRKQEIEQGLAVFNQLAHKFPGERRVQMMLGQLYMNQGKIGQAGLHFGRAAALDSGTGRVHGFIGNICIVEGDYSKAEQLYRKAISSAPQAIPFVPLMGRVFAQLYQGDVQQALQATDTYMQTYVGNGGPQGFPEIFIWNMKARINLENGHPKKAIDAYEKGLESLKASTAQITAQQRQTWIGRYHHGRARALAKMGKHEEAAMEAALIKKMIDEGGDQGTQFLPAYHYLAGYLMLEKGDFSKAIEHLKLSDPNDPFHRLLLARAYAKSGEKEKARLTYKEVADFKQNTMERALSYTEAVKALQETSSD